MVVGTASAFLTSERSTSRQANDLSVEVAWARMDCTSYAGQTTAARTLALVKAVLVALNEAPDPVLWPNPRGRVRDTQPREIATQRQSRSRGPHPWEWRQNLWEWRPSSPTWGRARRIECWCGSGRSRGGNVSRTTGAVAAAQAEATEGVRTPREGVWRGTAR